MKMVVQTTITVNNEKDLVRVRTALSVVQELEHMFDGVNKSKMDALGVVYDILADIELEKGETA